ncbi:MAG: hypothetical protein M3P82_01270, partial [Bacteroidota bacterium]|nr:hypothetical protein [Bacteroidota bacterium]
MNTGKVITFDNVNYNLLWSSHPSDNYYKQEYLPEKDTLKRFKKLILLEVATGKTPVKDIVTTKIAELKRMNESDPIINYEMFEKDGEIMLDFLVSENIPDRKELSIVERNVYCYRSFTGVNGKEGVLLFGVSERAYGEVIN